MRGFLVLLGDGRPDAGATWSVPGVRVEAGDGAVFAQRGPLAAVADLRLDNRSELRSSLDVPPEAGDVDLLLAAYDAWGADAPSRLDGPFAFVVWDSRTREAHVARDALGLRPLHWAHDADGLAFGTDLGAVRRLADPALCPEAVADHLGGTFTAPWQTLTDAVERVPPAHAGTISEAGVARWRRFWSLDASATLRLDTDAAYADAFREAFDRAVDARLGDDTAAFLSGGLDSSSIVVTARALRPEAVLPTLSIVYDTPAADERRYVEAVVAQGGLAPRRVDGSTLSLLGGLDADLRAVGEPFPAPNLFLTRSLHAEAARLGADAVLDGFAGDSVVGHGDVWLTELARRGRWLRFAREARAVAARSQRPRRMMLDLVRDYALPQHTRPALSFAHPDLPGPFAPPPSRRTDRGAHHAELAGPLLPRAFEAAYATAAAHGVAPRYPFADRRLVELCLSFPSEQRLRDGLTRHVLRRAMRGRLPDVLRDRAGKARLGGMFEDALFDREPDVLRRLVYEDVPAASHVLDVPAVQAAYEQARAEAAHRPDVAVPLWRAVALARWLRLR